MIQIKLQELATAKGFNRGSLATATGISYPTVLLFWNKKVKKVDLDILERLCAVLACTPGDLIQLAGAPWVPPPPGAA